MSVLDGVADTVKRIDWQKLVGICIRFLSPDGANADAVIDVDMATAAFQKALRVVAVYDGKRSREIDPDVDAIVAELEADDSVKAPVYDDVPAYTDEPAKKKGKK